MDSTSIHFPASSFAIAIAQRKQQQQKQLQQHKKNDNFFLIKNGPTLTFSIKFLILCLMSCHIRPGPLH